MLALSGGHAGRGGVTTYGDNRQLVPSAFPVPGLTLLLHIPAHTHHITHIGTCLFSESTLLPRTTKGNFSGSVMLAWARNSSLQNFNLSNEFVFVTSKISTQQSAPLYKVIPKL